MECCRRQRCLHDVSLSQLGICRKNRRERSAQLKALADDLIENYEECGEEFLTAESAAEAMSIADRVYDFSHRVLKNQHLFIFLFQERHKKEDSFCRCMRIADGSVAADIYMLVPHTDHEATPQSMFLHELGHCINIALTGNPEVVPEDFALVTSLIGVNQDDCDVSEFFAHCFAMSLLIEPDLLNSDPFKTVPLTTSRCSVLTSIIKSRIFKRPVLQQVAFSFPKTVHLHTFREWINLVDQS